MLAMQELMAVMRAQALIDLQICTLVAIAHTHLDSPRLRSCTKESNLRTHRALPIDVLSLEGGP